MNKILKVFLLFFILLSISSCKKQTYTFYKYDYIGYLDTIGYVIVEYDTSIYTQDEVKGILEQLNSVLLDIEKEFSIEQTIFMKNASIDKSTLMMINEQSGISSVKVSSLFMELLTISLEYAEMTNGLFDPTIGALTKVWDISSRAEYCREDLESLEDLCAIPSVDEINKAKELVNYQDIEINEETSEVFLKKEGMALDFGAIGKGYAGEMMKKFLEGYHFSYSIINMGGNVLVNGSPLSDIEELTIDIANPFGEETIGYYHPQENTGGVTSGTYERYITYEGVKYHHLLNPQTGYPSDNDIVSVTIMGPNSAIADALSTSIFMLGVSDGLALINELVGYEAVIITNQEKVYLSSNMNFILEENLEIIK